ncbi:hypothetical protein MMC07_000526 [Pseudocyphellaria aurata]|nr:hypothetical protein [Pseudocyphellaria aurata]
MDTPRVALVLFILIFLFILPDTQKPSRSEEQELGRLLVEKQNAVHLLNSTEYGALEAESNRWINITGFRHEDAYAWSLLPRVQEKAREQIRALHGLLETASPGSDIVSYKASGEEVPQKTNYSSIQDNTGVHHMSLYQNVSGIVHGQWARSKVVDGLILPVMNLSALTPHVMYVTKSYNRNITGQDGNLRIKLEEKISSMAASDDGSVREVRADLSIQDQSSKGDGWEMTLHGVHFPRQGGIILATTGQRFPGIFALPHFALTKHHFLLAQNLLNQTVNARLARQETLTDPYFSLWSSSPNNPSELLFPTPHCEYIVYLQQHPTTLPDDDLSIIEKELRFPTGAPTSAIPALKMSALIFSPDCGFVLESKGPPEFVPQDGTHLVGQKLESYMGLARRGILAFAVILCAEIFLIIRQMKETSTPSTRSRVSFYTVSLMTFGDGFAFMGLMAVVVSTDAAFLPLIATAFVSFLSVAVFGMKFLMEVWTVQAPERVERDRRNAAANQAPSDSAPLSNPAIITAAGADALPLPATARRTRDNGPTNVILPPDQDLGAAEAEDNAAATAPAPGSTQTEIGSIYSQFYFLLFSVSFLSLQATSWPTTFRSIYANCLTFGYLSFWVPQIHRNIIRNCRHALRWEFVVGQSILRLTPFVYLYTVEDNILFVEIDQNVAYMLVGWVWIQIWALVSQEILGPRFFVPNGWAPPAYDYHPILREDDQEAGVSMPIGFTQTAGDSGVMNGETTGEGKRIFDCAICMQNLEVPVVRAGDSREGTSMTTTIFSRRAYMVTPCRHIFHTPCLEGWMRYRLQCPICRDNLPPL